MRTSAERQDVLSSYECQSIFDAQRVALKVLTNTTEGPDDKRHERKKTE